MDIRNYFQPVGSKKSGKSLSTSKDTKKKNVIVDSDEEDQLPSASKRKIIVDSDSDDDLFKTKNKKKVKKEEKVKSKPQSLPKPCSPKLKPVAPTDYFGKELLFRKEEANLSMKRKKGDGVKECHSDTDFEKTLHQLDHQHLPKKPKSSSHKEDKPKPNEDCLPDKEPPNDFEKTLHQLDHQHLPKKPKSSSRKEDKQKPSEDCLPDKEPPQLTGLSSKLSEKLKQFACKKEINEEEKTPHKSSSIERNRESVQNHERTKQSSVEKVETETKCKGSTVKEKIFVNDDERSIKYEKVKESTRREEKRAKNLENVKETDNVAPEGKKEISHKKEKRDTSAEKKVKEGKTATPKKEDNNKEPDEAESTPQDKKKQSKEAYMKYLRRSGPANPGSKLIPQGEPECLQGLVFVLSGVFESLDREEASELIKKYGGKVTTSLSRNTTYLLLGSDAGASKLKKAEQLGTKQLDEDGLLELIRTRPGKGPKPSLDKEGKTSKKAKSFVKGENGRVPQEEEAVLSFENSAASGSPLLSTTTTKTPSPKKRFSHSDNSQDTGSPSSTSSSPKTQSISSQELSKRPSEVLMWVDKYKPSSIKNIIGQQGDRSNVKKLHIWLQNWQKNQLSDKKPPRPSPWAKDDNGAFFKAALLSGPPGVGKTTSAHLVCKELGFDVVELNASDARSKRTLDNIVSELLSNKSLAGYASSQGVRGPSSKHVLVMDEVDGMSGNEDRGGVQELIALMKKSKVPIIAMCNDRNHPKIRSLANYCFDLRFYKPRIEQIRGPMMSICFREGIKIKPDALDQIIVGANQDVRQILHHLSMWSVNAQTLQVDDMKKEAERAKKDFKMGPWDVCKAVFSESGHKNMSIHDKSGLFFHDYSIAPLFVQENYPKAVPHIAKGNRRITLEQLAKTAGSLADGDLIEKAIRSVSAWSLLPTQAMFSSVFPGEYMSGHLASQIEFPRWLGNNSRRNKFDRLMQELQMHTRLRISGSKLDVGMDYCGSLRKAITTPLVDNGADGVADAVLAMTSYDLLREDMEAIIELSNWPGMKDPMSSVESKVKAAFTRTYNKDSHLNPFATTTISKKRKGSKVVEEDPYGEGEEDDEEDDSIEEDITASGMIKTSKGRSKGVQEGSSKGRGRGVESSGSSKGSGRGRGRGKGKK
nr:replication factor C subunit 1-like [Procambarus clarkii]